MCGETHYPGRFGTMKTEIQRLQREELLGDGPPLVVVAKSAGKTLVERYMQHANAGKILPSGELLVIIIRSPLLSTPDKIRVARASCDGRVFQIELAIRNYEGDLLANDSTVVLIQLELGRLTPGDYQVVFTETTLYFMDLKHPENAVNPTTKLHQFRFKAR